MKNFQLAKFYQRLSAFIFDAFIVSVVYGVIIALITGKPANLLNRLNATSGSGVVDIMVISIILLVLLVFIPTFNKGMTFGQRLMSIKMIKDNYEETNMSIFLLRYVFIFVLSIAFLGLPLIINAYLMLFRRDNKTIQDLLFKTSVIQTK